MKSKSTQQGKSARFHTVQALRKRDQHYAAVGERNTVAQVRDAIRRMDVQTLSADPLTPYELQLTLFTIVKSLHKEQLERVCEVREGRLSDEQAWAVVLHATPEQAAYLHRCNILNLVGTHAQKDFATGLFFEWVNSRDRSIVPAAEQRNREMYLRRHEKIEARIAEIELGKL